MTILKRIALLVPALAFSTVAMAAEGTNAGETGVTLVWWIAPISALMALGFAFYFYKKMMEAPEGTEKMIEIARHVREGAYAYLFRQYSVVTLVFIVLLAIFAFLAYKGVQNPFVPVAFLTGGFFSGLCGFLGMKTATNASARTAQGASKSLNSGLQVAFRSGAVMGLVVVGFGLFDISMWYLILDKVVYTTQHMTDGLTLWGLTLVKPGMEIEHKLVEITTTMITFGMGASTQALFARVGGGIYTKAADVGADLVGKVEAGIPEDDPRNPATIADNVGDNVGDVAGMGADLYESYCGSILATAALGAALTLGSLPPGLTPLKAVLAPMVVAGLGILLSIAGMFMVRCKEDANQKNLLRALLIGTLGSSVLIIVAVAGLAAFNWITWGVFGSVISGLVAGVLIGQFTEYYTSDEYKPTRGIADQAEMGPATTIIDGLATGMYSAGLPVITIVIGILCAFGFAGGFSNIAMGLYGIGFAAVGMLATLGITLATDAYGPIADNAGGNAEMAGLGPEVRKRTDALDSLGNTTAATGKGFAIGSAALTAMALLAAYIEEIRIWIGRLANESADGIYQVGSIVFSGKEGVADAINVKTATMADFVEAYNLTIMSPKLIGGIFIGAMMAFVFSAMTMKAVGRAAGAMVNEVRRQFR
ncbi:MAG TPA: sodium-translocating pyrophosphatase, partial [Sedimentisphaerales bacterium]|nr:sodium-translocating pyrophosphatase [Sedimentisphaerales bacterium]